MTKIILEPTEALNDAFKKVNIGENDFNNFKTQLKKLIANVDNKRWEEFHKTHVRDFLRDTYYGPNHNINSKANNDLVIHNGKSPNSDIGVIMETKRPGKKHEMPANGSINKKGLQELVLYFLRERITNEENEIKHLVVTNVEEWFIFDAQVFEKVFFQDNTLQKKFKDFENKKLSGTSTGFFYAEIAAPAIEKNLDKLTYTHFRLSDYEKYLESDTGENELIILYKLLSPEHLLKLDYVNDSNTLDERFYRELLHIIGLTEVRKGGKKLIERKKEGQRASGSLIENTIHQLDTIGKVSRMEGDEGDGDSYEDRLFHTGLELCITWMNRILFLKLLEGQLIKYHDNDKSHSFLNIRQVPRFGELNALFFSVLARKPEERSEYFREKFAHVPYLNSSLFELTEVEDKNILISNLFNERKLPLYGQTVLRQPTGKRKTGEMNTLEYLFSFLDAYDFASEGKAIVQKEKQSMISASVLGLIFEKINGYKDGSFFTPGFITMYMCRKTIRKAVLQKFKEANGWDYDNLRDLHNKIEPSDFEIEKANEIVNSLKICDPAVGSGHFLVSALNEIIAIKQELGILTDKDGNRLHHYDIKVEKDELAITERKGEVFEYRPGVPESQRVQEALFHEKQTIIENCLFGVDINPNSVRICRLRLWIELLKNAYYKEDTGFKELETLPNIDINIKCGNSLVSRFPLDADLGQALKKSTWNIDSYRVAVATYRNAESKEQKRKMERLIADIKSDFRSEISANDPKIKKLRKLSGELFQMTNQQQLFEMSKKEKADWNKKIAKLTADTQKLEKEIAEIKANKIFENAFEWRFEFPAVLDDNGSFVGFDVVIGNPPYIDSESMVNSGLSELRDYLTNRLNYTKGNWDIYIPFYETSFNLLSNNGVVSFITPDKWISKPFGLELRKHLLHNLFEICEAGRNVFDSALVDSIITFYYRTNQKSLRVTKIADDKVFTLVNIDDYNIFVNNEYRLDWLFSPYINIIKLIEKRKYRLHDIGKCENACSTSDAYKLVKCISTLNNQEKFDKERHLKIINTGTIGRYQDKWGKKEMTYLKKKYLYPIAYRKDFLYEFCNTYGAKAIMPKLIIKGLTLLEASIDKEGLIIPGKSTLLFSSPDPKHLLFALGIINSKLMQFYIKEKYRGSSYNQGISFTKHMINNFPIPEYSERLFAMVSEIIESLEMDLTFDSIEIENQIDQLVYQLYDLTDEEIQIIENS